MVVDAADAAASLFGHAARLRQMTRRPVDVGVVR